MNELRDAFIHVARQGHKNADLMHYGPVPDHHPVITTGLPVVTAQLQEIVNRMVASMKEASWSGPPLRILNAIREVKDAASANQASLQFFAIHDYAEDAFGEGRGKRFFDAARLCEIVLEAHEYGGATESAEDVAWLFFTAVPDALPREIENLIEALEEAK